MDFSALSFVVVLILYPVFNVACILLRLRRMEPSPDVLGGEVGDPALCLCSACCDALSSDLRLAIFLDASDSFSTKKKIIKDGCQTLFHITFPGNCTVEIEVDTCHTYPKRMYLSSTTPCRRKRKSFRQIGQKYLCIVSSSVTEIQKPNYLFVYLFVVLTEQQRQ